MNVTIKSKFSMIIVFMILVSIIFSYSITTVIIYSNIESRFNKLAEKKKSMIEFFKQEIKNNLIMSSRMLASDTDLKNFLKGYYTERTMREDPKIGKYFKIEEIKDKNYYFYNLIGNFEKRLEEYSNYIGNIKVNIIYKNGEDVYDNAIDSYVDDSKDLLNSIDNKGQKESVISNFNIDKLGNLFLKVYTPIFEDNKKDVLGGVVVKCEIGDIILKNIKKDIGSEIIITNKNNVILSSTFEKKLINMKVDKASEYELDNDIYKLNFVEIVNFDKNVIGYIVIADRKNEVLNDIKEIAVYLFVLLFFVFSLIFLFSIEVIDSLVDSIKELTMKVNKLRRGDFDISFGKLKKKNDEIGVLAQDFEEMVFILKNKIDEFQSVSKNKEDYAEKLELANKELEHAKEKMEEKNKNIDIINKTLKSRIAEISNLYYLVISLSKDIIGDKFYSSIIRGIKEGLGIKKIALYEKEEDKYIIKTKTGITIEKNEIELNKDVIASILSRDIVTSAELKKNGLFLEYEVPYMIPFVSDKEKDGKELYGFLFIDNQKEFEEQDIQSIITYVRTIALAFENRKLYKKLFDEIDKLEHTTAKLIESEKFKNIFLANVSHEIKSPIVPIKGYIEMMVEGKIGEINVKQRKALIVSLKNIERLEEIIDNILNYSRIESGKYQIMKKKFNLVKIISEAIIQLNNKIEDKKMKILKEYKGYNFDAYADSDAIKLVFINLLSNSIKFSKEGDAIKISVTEVLDCFEIAVEDEGLGIEKENMELIFESFKQIEEGDTRKYTGVGLGLTIVKYILDLHDQDISIESHLNKGTKVTFRISKN